MKTSYLLTIIALCTLLVPGCKKDFLDAKPSSSIIQPKTLDDFQNLLENYTINQSPALATLSADEYDYINYAAWQSAATATERNSFVWSKDIFAGQADGGDWSIPYQAIFYANNVLTGLEKINNTERDLNRMNYLRGWALFTRAFAYYELVNNFSPAYDAASAGSDLGVPLKTNPSVDDVQPRASVQKTYDFIFSDLRSALPLLSDNVPAFNRERPSKVAAHALLARIYLNMRKYDLAELHADSALFLYNKLIDYNSVSQTVDEPFSKTNDELIFYKSANGSYSSISTFFNFFTVIQPALMALYKEGDLRVPLYFSEQPDGSRIMKIQYDGFTTLYPFTGLATDELYLIKAECAARRNALSNALDYLNALLIKRYSTNKFSAVSAANSDDALAKILLERQKELVWRNLRWDDLKRLNKEGYNISLTRNLNGQVFTLRPNDPKYVFPIPENEIQLSKIPQNLR